MKIAATLLVLLVLSNIDAGYAQRSRRSRQPAPKPTPSAAPSVPAPPTPVTLVAPELLATVNGQDITTSNLDPHALAEAQSLPSRLAEARTTVLEMEINTLLLDSEAKRRKLTSQQLYDIEVAKKLTRPTAAEIDAFIANNRDKIYDPNAPSLREDVEAFLTGERETELSKSLVARLRQSHKVVMGPHINTPNLAPGAMLATVGGRAITSSSLTERLKPIIYKMRSASYLSKKAALEVTINDTLLLAEANRLNLAPEELVRKEVTDKAKSPTEAEIAKFYEENKSRINGTFETVKPQIASYLEEQNRRKLEEELSARLRKGANIRILLTEPERPVQAISVDDDPSRGDVNAPVTVVVFTDFECPSCAATHPVLDDVLKSYGNNVRLVVRDYPLNRHANARKAAEAANAAHAQGKFFEYAALLFKRQTELDVASLKKYATEVGLNRATFDAALDSGKYAAEVSHDLKDGELYGVDSTPTIFVNGVPVAGVSADFLRAAIDHALTNSKAAPRASQ